MSGYTQKNRQLTVTTPLGDDVLFISRMTGKEALGRLFEYRVEMFSEKKDIDFAKMLGKKLTVKLELPDKSKREFNGIVTRFSCSGGFGEFTHYVAEVRPWFWLLTRTADCFIFQDMTVIEIFKKVCQKAAYGGMATLEVKTELTYEKIPYCVQYRETDFVFLSRLMEKYGIYYYFKHEGGKHTLVLCDSYGPHVKTPKYEKVKFATDETRDRAGDERMYSLVASGEVQSSSVSLNDFDFEKVMASTSGSLRVKETIAAAFSQPAYEMYDYPGGYITADSGKQIAKGGIEALHGQCEAIMADSNARGLSCGAMVSLIEHPRSDLNKEYLITDIFYTMETDDFRAGHSGGAPLVFGAHLIMLGKEHRYRPLPSTPRPRVYGPQTAIVVGKSGEEVWTDKYGRVKVQFHWDREGKNDEKSSCFVRVAQSWAGKRWGTMFIPRVGMEVVVEFLEGDPDRPLITGCVYNSDNMPPYDLPANQTRSTMKTNSSKGGGGFNELRFEDKKDAEEIFVQAQLDMNTIIKRHETRKVGFEAKDPGNQTIEIKNDQKLEVGNDQTVHIVKNQTVNVDADQTTHVKKNQSLTVDMNQNVKVNQASTTEAIKSLELKVGASSIKLEPAKITIKAPQISISADATAEFKAGAKMDINGGAMLTVQGGLVKIN
ncbi:type VI secretion system tip protein TssI/VgrG [Massilia sp. W12]|uniref:type VI secretion system Vgr family protein n=1 Tax=Massilia sp. W12 TaxID=3126507 RepID=UPI0030D278E7